MLIKAIHVKKILDVYQNIYAQLPNGYSFKKIMHVKKFLMEQLLLHRLVLTYFEFLGQNGALKLAQKLKIGS